MGGIKFDRDIRVPYTSIEGEEIDGCLIRGSGNVCMKCANEMFLNLRNFKCEENCSNDTIGIKSANSFLSD